MSTSSTTERPRDAAGDLRLLISDRSVAEIDGELLDDSGGSRSLLERESTFRLSLAAADITAAVLAVMLCVAVIGDDRLTVFTLLAAPVIVLVSKIVGLYDRDELLIHKTTLDEAPMLFQMATAFALVFTLLQTLFVNGSLGMIQIGVLWLALFFTSVGCRVVARRLAMRMTPVERILVAGDAASCRRIRTKLSAHHHRAEVVGRLALDDWVMASATGQTRLVEAAVSRLDVHRIVIVPNATVERAEALELIRNAKAAGVRVSLLPDVLEVVGSSVVFDDLYGLPILGVRRFGLSRSSWLVKRSFDLAGSLAALFVFGPLMVAIAIAIKLDSRGPVFFRQERVGRDGRIFRMLKFRSMVANAEELKRDLADRNEGADGFFKIDHDPRITAVGRLLRRTSLDELPQLLNVVKGEMSLVGPRPLIVDEDQQIDGCDRRRLALTPGMTGHWQILGSSRVPLAEMVKIDYLYVAGWSLWSDIKLLVRTVPYVLARRSR